jgi:HEAT repeat protein
MGSTARASVDRLKKLLTDDDGEIQLLAASALWRISGRSDGLLPVLTARLKDDEPRLRMLAMQTLGELGGEARSTLPLLTVHLSDGEEFAIAYEAICRIADDALPVLVEAVGPKTCSQELLVEALELWGSRAVRLLSQRLSTVDGATQKAILTTLGKMSLKDKTAGEHVRALMYDADAEKALMAVAVLTRLDPQAADAVPVLRRFLYSREAEQRATAAFALAQLETVAKSAAADLRNCLNDENVKVRVHAIRALGRVRWASSENECGIDGDLMAAALVDSLRDQEEEVRIGAIVALIGCKNTPELVMPALVDRLHDGRADERRLAMEVFKQAGPTAVPFLCMGLTDPRPSVRVTAVGALRLFDSEATAKAAPVVARLLSDSETEVRREAVATLVKIGRGAREAVPQLLAALKDEDDVVRSRAARALAETGEVDRKIQMALLDARSDTEAGVRSSVLLALASFVSEPVVRDAVEEALTDESEYVRKLAVASLANLPDRGVPLIVKVLSHDHVGVRQTAVAALIVAGPAVESARPSLIAALHDGDETVRRDAARVLGQLPWDEQSTSTLTDRLRHDDSLSVRERAALSLGQIQGVSGEPVTLLREIVRTDRSERVRCAAASALTQMSRVAEK